MPGSRGIVFDEVSVRGILAGTKTQTRRVVPPRLGRGGAAPRCRYGAAGDVLYVQEACWVEGSVPGAVRYCADDAAGDGWRRRPSRFMPRRDARLWLRLTAVRVEPLQAITPSDCRCELGPLPPGTAPCAAYRALWDRLNGPRGFPWAANPAVWVLAFERIDGTT